MKKILVITLMLITTTAFAQNKNAQTILEVDGICMMCKSRIEKACLSTKGVKSANWNVETHELKVYFDERKTNLDTIKSKILGAGHDLKELKATDEAYATVHPCCRYRDVGVVDDHKGEERIED
ncbi:heavy-metal-associated domain-containing protein [Flavisericum labens]|uniref:heavy-metal-associated domain-containing protein n=1 Tax=Flavisericum labens TaxID=3377112 RepID=UPI00387ADE7A